MLVTIADNDKYFLKTIALLNSNLSLSMEEENIDNILELLPKKYQSSTIVRLDKLEAVVNVGV